VNVVQRVADPHLRDAPDGARDTQYASNYSFRKSSL
jgi:hypothetical protein